MALGLTLLLPLLALTPAQADNAGGGDAVLYSLVEHQRREARVCDGVPMPQAQSLVPSMDLSDLLEAGLASDTSPAAFAEANGLKDVRYQIIRVPGKTPQQAFDRLLDRQCADIMSPGYRYVGIANSGGEWALLLSTAEPTGDSRLARSQGESILLAANSGSSLPVIPKVPERSKRAPRRPAAPAPTEMTQAPAAPAVAPAAAPASKMMAAPAPVSAPAAPAAAASAPAPMAVSEPVSEPLAPDTPKAPVAAAPKATSAPLPFYEEEPAMPAQVKAEPRPRTRRYDPNLVKDPSAATPYVTKEIIIEDGKMLVEGVPSPAPGAASVAPRVVESAATAPAAAPAAVAVSAPVPRYSTQPMAVSSPGESAAASAAALNVHSPYPGTIGSAVPSHSAQIYTDVPPARTEFNTASELPRDRMTLTPTLPPERISAPLAMELPLHRVMPLRPRR
jgi:hypothetical protein